MESEPAGIHLVASSGTEVDSPPRDLGVAERKGSRRLLTESRNHPLDLRIGERRSASRGEGPHSCVEFARRSYKKAHSPTKVVELCAILKLGRRLLFIMADNVLYTRFKINVPLVPPKPNELLKLAFIFNSRATFGT